VLARLNQEPEVEAAQVDRRGEVLRVRLRSPGALPRVTDLLVELGFAGEVVAGAAGDLRWYGAPDVGELSREEAG